ncbi:hypothetical protein PR048_010638 [Dryococelus australis]|uniref:Integrase catalytic domain-containing protein n=1 Tax=Dryococelus australis TaxID=614101 RepID=A0ABQ9I390_9NEOP|nr:hypothetical protein PR048_010638 [Dryococelus australis]
MHRWSHDIEKETKPYWQVNEHFNVGLSGSGSHFLKWRGEGHLGDVKIKSLARAYFWWPGMDSEIVRRKRQIQQNWPFPTGPWQRIHQPNIPFTCRSPCLRTHLVSDNGPPFNSVELKIFLAANGVQSILTVTYDPQSNGQPLNSITVYKLRTAVRSSTNIPQAITNLFTHSCWEIPASLMFGRSLHTNLRKRIEDNQQKQRAHYKGPVVRNFQKGQEVLMNYNNENKWVKGVVIEKLSNVVYLVETAMR